MARPRHALEYALVRIAIAVLGRLSAGPGEWFGSAAGRLCWRLGWRRDVVEEQLAAAFPGRDAGWIARTARACFEHLGRESVALAALAREGPAGVRRAIESFEGLEELRAAAAAGRGVVVVSGHFGNWEVAGTTLVAYGFELDGVMQGLRNPYLDRYIRELRQQLGIRLIDRASAWDRTLHSLRQGRVVAFVADQDARAHGVHVPFFGRAASTHRVPALLALRGGAPLFVGGAVRRGPRRYGVWAVRMPPPGAGDPRERVRELTRRWTEELERRIRLSPEQYFWHHKRWKTRPPGTVPAGIGSIQGGGTQA